MLVDAAPKLAVVKHYNAGHILISSKAAVHDMLAFLSARPRAGPRVQGADVGP